MSQDSSIDAPGGLRGLSDGAGQDATTRLNHALDQAGKSQPKVGWQIDRETVAALRTAPQLDELLTAVDLARLAELVKRATAGAAGASGSVELQARRHGWEVLDLVRRPAVLRRITENEVPAWSTRILELIDTSRLTVGPLFRQRAELYGSKVLFEIPRGDDVRMMTWRQAASRVDFLAKGLLSLDSRERPAPIAILSENRLESALTDLACLTTGLTNVMIPANATETDVAFMLRHSGCGTVIVSTPLQLQKVRKQRDALPDLQRAILIDPQGTRPEGVMTLDDLASRALHIPDSLVTERVLSVSPDDRASVMYTSGTTGNPKGIQFSQRNLVFKRFARALALPEIGEDDVFLCFLPLYHTFGRFLELMGTIFLGATYCFLENPSVEALVSGMRRHRPTVFISVPKKWIQLYEAIGKKADPFTAEDDELLDATRQITGGRLRWGLSAAGHLDSDIFRFFQRQGVELLSGFGMTEATGGITMTRPGEYRDDSLGYALPGIEAELAEDGELLVRGPYVMMGYLDPPEGELSFDDDGWFHTGDLMERSPEGHLRLIDRKKEIYKNVKGETIAPQRVESLFRDFEAVGRAFLVGDHREYNTLLIYPNPKYRDLDWSKMSREERWHHFRSLVVSVNKFLAPYERIVDFAVIDRDLSEEQGELTPKGTARRSTVVRNFSETIRGLYRKTEVQVGGVDLTLPNWLFQSLGVTVQDFRLADGQIVSPATGTSLTVQKVGERMVRVGSMLYRLPATPLNLGMLLTVPRFWLGNRELVEFVPLELDARFRPGRPTKGPEWVGQAEPFTGTQVEREALAKSTARETFNLLDLDIAARFLMGTDEPLAIEAARLAARMLDDKQPVVASSAREVLGRASTAPPVVAREAFIALLPSAPDQRFREILHRFVGERPELLDTSTRERIVDSDLPTGKLEAFVEVAQASAADPTEPGCEVARGLFHLLAAYGAAHPSSFRRLRAFLTRMGLFAGTESLREGARTAGCALREGFRTWLGPASKVAVDPETGREYRWDNVVVFEEDIPQSDRDRVFAAIQQTPMLREALFLFSTGRLIRLSDVPPGGVSVRLLGSRHGKSVYRITVQTRFQDAFDLAVNLNHTLEPGQVEEEIHWLVLSGEVRDRDPLVEDFGGYWPDQGLWTEEFITGETLDRAMRRLARRKKDDDGQQRLQQLWPFLAWSTLSAYVDFWNRSGKRWEIADPSLSNVVVPTEDFHIGARIVSLSARRPHGGLTAMMLSLEEQFVAPAEELYPALRGLVNWALILSSLLEITGEREGLEMLERNLETDSAAMPPTFARELRAFVDETRARGFRPMRLHFAVARFHQWEALGADPTSQARARTLRELYDTYGIWRLEASYPEIRLRFFRETAFRRAQTALAKGLDELIAKLRCREMHVDELPDGIADLRSMLDLGPEDDYFLARVSFPHLRPEDEADFVSSYLGGKHQSEIVVTLEDQEGRPYRVRHALNPKEVERLHRLFLAAKLEIRFRLEHQYLVAINERGQIIAGIYYEIEEDAKTAHLEKIAVSEPYRRKGIADGLMREFFNRLRAAGVDTVTTGFFRPEYFYAHGFSIEKRYAGLVKNLDVR